MCASCEVVISASFATSEKKIDYANIFLYGNEYTKHITLNLDISLTQNIVEDPHFANLAKY